MIRLFMSIVVAFAFVSSTNADIPPSNVARIIVEDRDNNQSAGTGTLVRSDLVVTNWHVIKDRAQAGVVRIVFPDWTVYKAKVIKVDKLWDLAALRIESILLPPVELGEKVRLGDIVTVGGYGSGWYEANSGAVIGFYQPAQNATGDLIQINASVRNGDSGGPILDKDGKLVGVLFGASDGTYGTNIERVRKFLKEVD